MQEGRQSRASRVSIDDRASLTGQQALLAPSLGSQLEPEGAQLMSGARARRSHESFEMSQEDLSKAGAVEPTKIESSPGRAALFENDALLQAASPEVQQALELSEEPDSGDYTDGPAGIQRPILLIFPESEQAEGSQLLDTELDKLDVQQSQYDGVSDTDSDLHPVMSDRESYQGCAPSGIVCTAEAYRADQPDLEYSTDLGAEEAEAEELADQQTEQSYCSSASALEADVGESMTFNSAARLQLSEIEHSEQQAEMQGFDSESRSSSEDQQPRDSTCHEWGGRSSQPGSPGAAIDSLVSVALVTEPEQEEDADFSVDTEVVMAYTDESVRHYLQAMELTDTLDTFEREWEHRHSLQASYQQGVSSMHAVEEGAGVLGSALQEGTASQGLPTPRTGHVEELQAQLQATQQALHEMRALVSLKEQAGQDAAVQAQQAAAEAIATAERAAEAARQQAAEAIHHARLAAAAAERNARELQAMQQQQREQQEAQRRQWQAEEGQRQHAMQVGQRALPAQSQALQLEQQQPSQEGSQQAAPPPAAPAARRMASPQLRTPPGTAGQKVGARDAQPRSKPRLSIEAKASNNTKPVATVRAAEAAEQKAPGKAKLAPLPTGFRPVELADATPADARAWWLLRTVTAHARAVSGVAVHPTKPIAVTSSDDRTWRMWHLPSCERIMTGEGHAGWVAGLHFHPQGTHLASASGDMSVKLWSFAKQRCVATFKGHTQAVWGVAWHDQDPFLASCSMDQSLRIWDSATGKCRQVLRGHADSVNDVCWQPFSGNVCSASADNSVCLWDARTGLPVVKLYGHESTCNCATFNPQGSTVASCDASGVVRLWDVRKMAELHTVPMMPAGKAANSCQFDGSGAVLAVSSDAGKVVCYSASTMEVLKELAGHTGGVHGAAFSPQSDSLLSVGSDCTLRMWAKHA